ncbi:PLP-dependent cysteine synthase family protein [Lederbergia lenta]|uniref:Pyridoxal-5'-phosphate-dependent protein subunit beta n=1 Tax=Lederbergia lenta TaxID=1467 RepID=A0A2X4VFX9_LEDLE|nr:cysteine synthase family protein [Lederbergia lenta]MCM3113544.1 cysteine synthase family protein [Lederbergia lenta]MEC2323813.1 cysteine synthase family protein [Lederbergia lenta]SQI51116.1 Pyridoxal-5'-phosphate-dependent protein subunit beta [Lederbergia lenta]
MKYVKKIQDLIGHTPLLEITAFSLPVGVRLFAKLEYFNPGGSIKDRLGMYLLKQALESGQLKKGGTIIEPTAGNTGIGLALAALEYEVNAIFVTPKKFSREKQTLMRALGAKVINTPTQLGMEGAIQKAKELIKCMPDAFYPGQFQNKDNPETYYESLGPELYESLDGEIDIFVAGAGSGGTFMGTSRFLKEKNKQVKCVIVEPEGSILNGGEPGSHRTEGIGMEFMPAFMDLSYIDNIYTIPDEKAFYYLKELALRQGLLVGSSSGAAMAASLAEAEKAAPNTNIVTIFPDSSERYISSDIYDEVNE